MSREWKPDGRTPPGSIGPERPTLGNILSIALMIVLGLLGLVALTISASGMDENGHYLVISAPSFSADLVINAISAAGGAIVDKGTFKNAVFAWSDSPDFPTAAREAGAWFVISASGFAGCLTGIRKVAK